MKKTKKYNTKLLFGGVWLLVIVLVVLCILFCKWEKTMCEMTVDEYLAAANFEWEGQTVQKWDEIVVDYIWRLADGTVFDTSIKEVAKSCDKYNENRNYDEWLSFKVGLWQMIAGFDRWVEGMKIGQTKTIEIPAKDAYGERKEDLVMKVEKSKLELPWQYKKWDVLYAPTWQTVKVVKVTEKEVYLDTNHELAGKDLIFDITLKEIK